MLHANSQSQMITSITVRFTIQLHCWWEYYLTPIQRNSIINSVKQTQEGNPFIDANSQTISNPVKTLIHNFLINFSGNVIDQIEKYRELINHVELYLILDGTKMCFSLSFFNYLTLMKNFGKKSLF